MNDLGSARVAVTGATGFVGRYLVRALQSRGARVIGAVRNPDKVPALAAAGDVELRRADLADRAALAEAFAGADAVIHNAAVISVGRLGKDELVRTNTEGTRNVMEAAAAAGIRRAVMTSSATVYRPVRGHVYRVGDPTWDADDRVGRLRYYALSKAAAERAAREVAAARGIALAIARPHQVFGAFDQGSFTRYFRMLMRPPITVWFTHVELPSIYAGDLAEAMVRMLEVPAAAGATYNVAGDEPTSWWAHFRAWRRAGGPRRLALPIPIPVRRVLAPGDIARDLGWHPRPLEDAFRETLALERGEALGHDPEACGPRPRASGAPAVSAEGGA